MHDVLRRLEVARSIDRASGPKCSLSSRHLSVRVSAVLLVLTLAMGLVTTGSASPADKPKPWVAKDWTHWTWEDCIQVLNYSPWSDMVASASLGRFSESYSLVQLRSALPVRQALLRNLQVQKHYDKMDDQKKREFDQKNSVMSDEDAVQNFTVLIDEVVANNGKGSGGAPVPATQIALRISNGTLVLPIRTNKANYASTQLEFDAIHNQFEYVFPRTVDGKPLYSFNDPFIVVDFGDPLIVDKKTGKVEQRPFHTLGDDHAYKLKTSDLIYQGKLEY
jgi:hypothetical protein